MWPFSFFSLGNWLMLLSDRCIPPPVNIRWQSTPNIRWHIITRILILSFIRITDVKIRLNLEAFKAIICCIWLHFLNAFYWRPIHQSLFSLLLDFLFSWRWLWFVPDVSTFFNVSFSCLFTEGSSTMRTLNCVAGRLLRWYLISQLSYFLLYLWIRFALGITFKLINLLP
jgi:hypothetical protein